MKRLNYLMAFLLLTIGETSAQSKLNNPTNQLSIDAIAYLAQASMTEINNKLYGMNWNKMNDVVSKTITQEHIDLTYIGYPFIKVINKESTRRLWIFQSMNTLENIIEFEILPSEENIWLVKFNEANYSVNDWNDSIHRFRGKTNGKYYLYEIRIGRGMKNTIISVRNQDEIDDLIETKKNLLEKMVNWHIDSAIMEENMSHYINAINILHAASFIYEPRKEDVSKRLAKLNERAMEHYFTLLKKTNLRDSSLSISYCDTLDMISLNNDTVRQIRDNLKRVSPYSKVNYTAYKEVSDGLADIIEGGIASCKRKKMKYPITLKFTFLTDSINKSFGEISFNTHSSLTKKEQNEIFTFSQEFWSKMDSICQCADIQPIEANGINLKTRETINASISWEAREKTIVDSCIKGTPETEFIPHVKYIDSVYFTIQTYQFVDGKMTNVNQTRQPTKRIYTFCKTKKNCNGINYTDVELIDFETPGYTSWMPSLIIPGWGTYLQEKHSTIIARALPFFMFGTLSAAGFIWENGKGKEIERPSLKDGHADFPWEYKNFGYYIGWGCAAISATIYLTDIIEGIKTGNRNMRYSKNLRNELKKKGSIPIITEKIDLSKETKQ